MIFKKRYLELTHTFYEKNGGKTLIIGRLLPVIRTFAPVLAGIVKIDFRKFMIYNFIGALGWIGALTSVGYYLGTYSWVQNNIGYIVIGLIIITTIPIIITLFRSKK
ncbi:MAG: VTT domain-containing protein [Bacteroidia bacterium]